MTTAEEVRSLAETGYLSTCELLRNLNVHSVKSFYENQDPLVSVFVLMLVVSLVCFVASVVLNNISIVDMLWSVLPPLYGGYIFSFQPRDSRMQLAFLAISLWGARLTFNLAIKGGYSLKFEDYRWVYIKQFVHPAIMLFFNFTFVAFYQNFLLMLIVMPVYVSLRLQTPLNTMDYVAFGLFMLFLAIESISDWQQRQFRLRKEAEEKKGKKLTFLQSGLFYYSRHPNFWAEQMMWWSLYLFSVSATGQLLNWTVSGPVLLSLLFQGSTALTEKLALQKYPEYCDYQKTTNKFVMWFPSTPKQKSK